MLRRNSIHNIHLLFIGFSCYVFSYHRPISNIVMLQAIGKETKLFENNYKDSPTLVKGIVGGLTNLAKLLSPAESRQPNKLHRKEFLTPHEILIGIKQDFQMGYLFSGNIETEIYDYDCSFTDPTISFKGLQTFLNNIKSLESIKDFALRKCLVVLYSINLDESENLVKTKWRMSAGLELPWKPQIELRGQTKFKYSREQNGRIIEYDEIWDIPPSTALLQLLTPASTKTFSSFNQLQINPIITSRNGLMETYFIDVQYELENLEKQIKYLHLHKHSSSRNISDFEVTVKRLQVSTGPLNKLNSLLNKNTGTITLELILDSTNSLSDVRTVSPLKLNLEILNSSSLKITVPFTATSESSNDKNDDNNDNNNSPAAESDIHIVCSYQCVDMITGGEALQIIHYDSNHRMGAFEGRDRQDIINIITRIFGDSITLEVLFWNSEYFIFKQPMLNCFLVFKVLSQT